MKHFKRMWHLLLKRALHCLVWFPNPLAAGSDFSLLCVFEGGLKFPVTHKPWGWYPCKINFVVLRRLLIPFARTTKHQKDDFWAMDHDLSMSLMLLWKWPNAVAYVWVSQNNCFERQKCFAKYFPSFCAFEMSSNGVGSKSSDLIWQRI